MNRRWDGILFVLAILALWDVLYHAVGDAGMASPWTTFATTGRLLSSASFWNNASVTAYAFALAVLFAVAGGLTIGLVLGLWRFAGDVADPVLNALSALPKITLYPVILLFFGLGIPAKVAFGTIHGIFPVIILTMSGVRNIRPVYRKTALALRLTPWQTIRTVLFPAALPEIFTGLRIGIALALLGTLVGELFATDRGMGFLLMQGVEHQDPPVIMAITLLLFAVAVAGGIGLLAIDRKLHRGR